MKKTVFYLITMLGIVVMGCHSNSSKMSKWSDVEINDWFKQSDWNGALPFIPDESINKRLFVQYYEKDSATWKIAFNFLKNTNFFELPVGRYELSDNGMYATVSTYETKGAEEAQYEAHRKYVDIQYVVAGEEYIELLSLEQLDEKAIYDADNDIIFYTTETRGDRRLADKHRYFIFFPEDVHKPCLNTDTKGLVKKIVLKVPIY